MINLNKKTKIVCTIGPASDNYDMVDQLVSNGMNIMRINFSHGSYAEHKKKIEIAREYEKNNNVIIPVMLDTKGPEIRTHFFKGGKASIQTNAIVRISMKELLGDETIFSVTYPALYDDVKIGDVIKLDDGNLSLVVKEKDEKKHEIVTMALNHHIIKDRRGVNCPDVHLNMPYISQNDYDDITWGCHNDVDFISASFVRSADDILAIRKILKTYNREDIQIIAKIENPESVRNIDSILKVTDAIMVARGDLGVEIPPEDVPVVQKDIISKCRIAGIPVITATQMLDSMMTHPNPTRAEVSDVANAILDSTDCVMLSGESASGEYPVLATAMQRKIAQKMENYLNYEKMAQEAFDTSLKNNNDAIANSVANTALLIGAKLIVCFSETGSTAHRISKARPVCPILSVSNSRPASVNSLLYFGVYSLLVPSVPQFIEEMEVLAILKARELKIPAGSPIILTGGTPVGAGKTNFMKIIILNEMKDVNF